MLGEVPEHSVLVYESNATESAQIGELSVECLLAAGCEGAVLDGGARDVSYVLENDFPLFTRYLTPTDSIPRGELLDWGTRAVVGGVDVAPGDVIVSDVDGVVVVPAAISTAVLREAEALADTEDAVRQAVRDGVDPLNAYERHGVF
jgi:regulator of RNase E activity RraA